MARCSARLLVFKTCWPPCIRNALSGANCVNMPYLWAENGLAFFQMSLVRMNLLRFNIGIISLKGFNKGFKFQGPATQ